MSTEPFQPEQRRALRKAPDSTVHPSLPQEEEVEDLQTKVGSATSDTLRPPKKDKLVRLSVQVPKSLRASLRAEAERRGMSVDQLVAALLRDRTDG